MKKMIGILSIAVLIGAFAKADDSSAPGCFDPMRYQNEVQSQFQLTSYDPNLSYKYCDQTNLIFDTVQALLYLKDLPDVEVSNDEMDQGILGRRPYDFFKSHIQGINFEPDGGFSCQRGTMAYIVGQDPTMHVCPWMTRFDVLTNASVLIHESRHVDGFPHVSCTHGPYTTFGLACDPSYKARGSYATATEFEVKVSRSATVNDAVRINARGFAITDFMERFNDLPLGIEPGLLLESNDSSVSFFDGKSVSRLIGPRVGREVFFSTSSTRAGFFNPDDLSVAYYQSNGLVLAPVRSGLQDELRQGLAADQARTLQDIAVVGNGTCFLLAESMHCFQIGVPGSAFDVPLNGLKVSAFMPVAQSMIFREGDVYLVSDDGSIYTMPSFQDLKGSDPAKYPRFSTWLDLLAIAQISPDQEFVLRSNHQLSLFDTQHRTWIDAPGVAGQKFKRMLGPYFWSKRLDEL